MLPSKKFLTLGSVFAFLVVALGFAGYLSRPSNFEEWAAVSPYYLNEAAAEPPTRRLVPFCEVIRADQTVEAIPACAAWKRRPAVACGLQNIGPGGWDASVVNGDGEKAGVNVAAWMNSINCVTLVLDVESTRDRSATTRWITDLARSLRSQIPTARVSVAVHGKTDDAGSWYGAASQDWKALCDGTDELLLMAYDFSLPGVTPAGESAPLAWVDKVLGYALSVCPPQKVRLGLAAYGYDFRSRKIVTERDSRQGAGPGAAEVIVETAAKRAEKKKLAQKYGLTKLFLWAAGME